MLLEIVERIAPRDIRLRSWPGFARGNELAATVKNTDQIGLWQVPETIEQKLISALRSHFPAQVGITVNRGKGGAGNQVVEDKINRLDRLQHLLGQNRGHGIVGALCVVDRMLPYVADRDRDRNAGYGHHGHRDQSDLADRFPAHQTTYPHASSLNRPYEPP